MQIRKMQKYQIYTIQNYHITDLLPYRINFLLEHQVYCFSCILDCLYMGFLHFVTFVFCHICILLHLHYVSFAFCLICILSGLHFVSFAFCLICILLYLQYVGFAFCQICILSVFFAFCLDTHREVSKKRDRATLEKKVVSIYEKFPKKILYLTPSPKIALKGPKSAKRPQIWLY